MLASFEVDGAPRAAIYLALFAIWAIAISISVRGLRRDSAEERAAFDEGAAARDEERSLTNA